MKKYWVLLFILLAPDTLFCADYFLPSSCMGLTDIHGDVNKERLTSCINQLIDGINRTRQIIDSKINNTNSTVKSMGPISTGLKKNTTSEKTPNASEQHENEQDLKIKQLETRISILEKSLIELQSAKPNTK